MNQFYPHLDSNRKSAEEGQLTESEQFNLEKLPSPPQFHHVLNLQKSKESNIAIADEKKSVNGVEADEEATSIGVQVRQSQTFKIGLHGYHKKSKSQAFPNGVPTNIAPNKTQAYQQHQMDDHNIEIPNSATSSSTNAPGIYNMSMGQANQLKKTKI